jgi:outer membrane protein TolC
VRNPPGRRRASAALASLLALCAGIATAQPQAPAGAATIREALERQFQREHGRPPEKVRWLEIEHGQAALTALRRNLSIKSAQLGKDLSAAAYEQARALFDPVVTQSLTSTRSLVFARTERELEFRRAIECVAGVCQTTLANNRAVFSITFDEGRSAGFRETEVEASTASATGADSTEAYNARVNMLFPKGISAFVADSVVYKDTKFVEDVGTKIVGSYERPWTNQFNAGITVPLPGSKFFGDYATADAALRVADTAQQAAFWQIAALINDTLLQVEQGYWTLVLRGRIYDVTVQTRERVRALAARTERLFELGEATRYDKAKLEAQLAALRRQEREALNGFVAASNALASLLDLERDAILLPRYDESRLRESAAFELREALQQGAERNPSIRLAEVNKSIAEVFHEQGRVQLGPDLNATASFSRNQSNGVFGYRTMEEALAGTFSPDSRTQVYSLNFTRPWDNRAAHANARLAESRLRQQEILLEQTRRATASQIALAVTNLQSARQRSDLAARARDLAVRVFERAERQRALGVVSDFELIVKSVELLNADLELQAALLGQKISESAVYAAIGSLAQRYGEANAK